MRKGKVRLLHPPPRIPIGVRPIHKVAFFILYYACAMKSVGIRGHVTHTFGPIRFIVCDHFFLEKPANEWVTEAHIPHVSMV